MTASFRRPLMNAASLASVEPRPPTCSPSPRGNELLLLEFFPQAAAADTLVVFPHSSGCESAPHHPRRAFTNTALWTMLMTCPVLHTHTHTRITSVQIPYLRLRFTPQTRNGAGWVPLLVYLPIYLVFLLTASSPTLALITPPTCVILSLTPSHLHYLTSFHPSSYSPISLFTLIFYSCTHLLLPHLSLVLYLSPRPFLPLVAARETRVVGWDAGVFLHLKCCMWY